MEKKQKGQETKAPNFGYPQKQEAYKAGNGLIQIAFQKSQSFSSMENGERCHSGCRKTCQWNLAIGQVNDYGNGNGCMERELSESC